MTKEQLVYECAILNARVQMLEEQVMDLKQYIKELHSMIQESKNLTLIKKYDII